jgi:hypothetical protein
VLIPKNPRIPNPNDPLPNPLTGISYTSKVAGVTGIFGHSEQAVLSVNRAGVYGHGSGNGVQGESSSADYSGVWGNNAGGGYGLRGTSDKTAGIGVYGRGAALAGKFEGNVEVTGDIEVAGDIRLNNADCAEDFDIVGLEKVEPGTVMVIESEGALQVSNTAYDKRVAGVISGAGKYKPGIILDQQKSSNNRMPIALMGKVYCKVDAQYGTIEVGDLLTTSPTLGHAMKTDDPLKAFGAVIGKALSRLESGQGLIPILIALQ